MPPKKKVVKKKHPKKKGKKSSGKYISGDSFSDREVQQIASVIKKMRANKKGKKGKKVGIANMSSLMNLVYNTGRERVYGGYQRRYPRRYYRPYIPRNMMRAHPFKYPSLIQDANVNHIWNSTKLPISSKTKNAIMGDLNNIYKQLVGFNLLKSPMGEVGSINVKGADEGAKAQPAPKGPHLIASKPSRTPPVREVLPSRPSNAPPRQVHEDSSSSDEDDE